MRVAEKLRCTVSQSDSPQRVPPLEPRQRLWLAGLLALVLLTFLSTFTFGWVYDDPPQIPGNGDLRWDRLSFLFTHHLWSSASGISDARFYRPLLAFWFLLNKTFFGLDPHWFHVTTVLAHVLAVALAFFVARKYLPDFSAALFAAAIFSLHPLQVESASWISSVNDSLSAALCFASFLSCRKARSVQQRPVLWWTLSAAAFFAALLMKEVSAVLPAIILVDLWLDRSSASPPRYARGPAVIVLALFGALEIVWLILRRQALGQFAAAHSSIAWSAIFLTAPKIVLFHLYRVVLPLRLSPHYDFTLADLSHLPQSLLPLVAFLVLAVLAFLAARKCRELWLAYAWFLLPLVPTFNLRWMNEDDFVHDRYLYMSMFGVALLASTGFSALKRRFPLQHMLPLVPAVLVPVFAFSSALQSQYWANDVYLFSRAVQVAPNNEWAHLNYGAALSAREKYADAAPHFVRSYELKPGWHAADYAAISFQRSGDLAQAERWYRLALQWNPALADAWFGMGQIRLEQHRPAEAVALIEKALSITPNADGYYYALGLAFEQIPQPDAALAAYQTELRLHPYQTAARKAIERLSIADGPK
jgi:protein O-mannosyl-transferase